MKQRIDRIFAKLCTDVLITRFNIHTILCHMMEAKACSSSKWLLFRPHWRKNFNTSQLNQNMSRSFTVFNASVISWKETSVKKAKFKKKKIPKQTFYWQVSLLLCMAHWPSIFDPIQSGQKPLSHHSVCVGAEWTRMNQINVNMPPVVVPDGHTYHVWQKEPSNEMRGQDNRVVLTLTVFPLHHWQLLPTEASVNPRTLVLTFHEGQMDPHQLTFYLQLSSLCKHTMLYAHSPFLSKSENTHIRVQTKQFLHVCSCQLQISLPWIWMKFIHLNGLRWPWTVYSY